MLEYYDSSLQSAERFDPIVNVIAESGSDVIDSGGSQMTMVSQQTADILTGDPYFADPIDPTIARIFQEDWTGWILALGFTSGTCVATEKPVQNAIDSASSRTKIFISTGHYAETVSIFTTNLTLIGLGGDATIEH
jgi:hypothetical protein